jgi:hypothetical protein
MTVPSLDPVIYCTFHDDHPVCRIGQAFGGFLSKSGPNVEWSAAARAPRHRRHLPLEATMEAWPSS